MKKVVVLGSTGSVGTSALDCIAKSGKDFKVVGLTAQSNVRLLAKQVNRFRPRLIGLEDASRYNELKRGLKRPARVLKGLDGISEVASMQEADVVLVAISGTSCILPLISAIRAKKRIALANKESIVSAGSIITDMAKRRNVKIIPVDSEHNSIFQCIDGKDADAIRKIFLMGTGGPLKNVKKSFFARLKPAQVLAHPVWRMGKKITVDSATMMNKGLEIIEARYLFDTSVSKIHVLFHPEAIIHSMVEFTDGHIMANLFYPDMRLPISYALNYPERKNSALPKVNFSKLRNISFETPDRNKFPALGLCYDSARKGGTYPACLNAANEEAVRLYLKKKIGFMDIIEVVKKVLSRHRGVRRPSLDEILYVDKWAKEEVRRFC